MSTQVGTLLDYIALHLQEGDRTFSVTNLWSQSEVIGYISVSDREFLLMSGLFKKLELVLSVTNQIVYGEPSDGIDVERLSWNGKKLYPQTRFDLDLQQPNWRADTARNPRRYHRDGLPQKEFAVWPAPNTSGTNWTVSGTYGIPSVISGSYAYTVTGTYGIVSTIGGDRDYLVGTELQPDGIPYYGTWGEIASGSLNFIAMYDGLPPLPTTPADYILAPDAFSRYVMYGALAKIWEKEGDGQDLARAQYCRARFLRGSWLAKRLVYGDTPEMMEEGAQRG